MVILFHQNKSMYKQLVRQLTEQRPFQSVVTMSLTIIGLLGYSLKGIGLSWEDTEVL